MIKRGAKILLVSVSFLLSLLPSGQLQAQGDKYKLTGPRKTVLAEAESLSEDVSRMSMGLWNFSETALLESKSAALLSRVLEKEGFSVEKGVAGMPTAFIASYGSGKPIIGILAEYDALPGIGNGPVPRKESRRDGNVNGHGCGHNLFGAASVGAAIAIKRTLESRKISGTIRLYGTPAEETVVGKVYMAKAGVFDDLDASIDWHPSQKTGVGNRESLAMNNFQIEFFGQSAHSAADPWNGRSALDAVEMMNYGVNLMREHVQPTARIHYVIPNGGLAPNVVPDYAKVWYYVRDINRKNVEEYYGRILDIAAGSAKATRTEHKVTLITGVHAMLLNRPLIERAQMHLEYVGGPTFTEEEQNWAKELQRNTDKEEEGFDGSIQPLAPADAPPSRGGGSTDVAEVSHITPEISFGVTTAPANVPWHSWATAASHGTPAAVKGAMVATKAMSLMGIDLFTDEDLLAEAREFFKKKKDGEGYTSPIPQDQQVMLPEGN